LNERRQNLSEKSGHILFSNPYVNKPGIPPTDYKELTIKGVNLPTELTPSDIRIGETGEIEVTEILESTSSTVRVKMKVLKCIPGAKAVSILI